MVGFYADLTEEVGMGPNTKDYTTREKYAEQSSAERCHCFAIATPTVHAAQTCFVIWLIAKHILVQLYSLYI